MLAETEEVKVFKYFFIKDVIYYESYQIWRSKLLKLAITVGEVEGPRKIYGQREQQSLNDACTIAEFHGGICLSTEYKAH